MRPAPLLELLFPLVITVGQFFAHNALLVAWRPYPRRRACWSWTKDATILSCCRDTLRTGVFDVGDGGERGVRRYVPPALVPAGPVLLT